MNRNVIITSIYFLSMGYAGAGNITINNIDVTPDARMKLEITPENGKQIDVKIPQQGEANQVTQTLPEGVYTSIALHSWDPAKGAYQKTCNNGYFRVNATDTVSINLTKNPDTGSTECKFVNEAEFEKVTQ